MNLIKLRKFEHPERSKKVMRDRRDSSYTRFFQFFSFFIFNIVERFLVSLGNFISKPFSPEVCFFIKKN
jgi:hypothetical protein